MCLFWSGFFVGAGAAVAALLLIVAVMPDPTSFNA
jgi:hypothetical protein